MYVYTSICMFVLVYFAIEIVSTSSHSNVIFICNTKVIKLFWVSISPYRVREEPSQYPMHVDLEAGVRTGFFKHKGGHTIIILTEVKC